MVTSVRVGTIAGDCCTEVGPDTKNYKLKKWNEKREDTLENKLMLILLHYLHAFTCFQHRLK